MLAINPLWILVIWTIIWTLVIFKKSREGYHRLNLDHEIHTYKLDESLYLLKIFICVENVGTKQIKGFNGNLVVNEPFDDHLISSIKKGQNPINKNTRELEPTNDIDRIRIELPEHYVEPNERDKFPLDVILRGEFKNLRIYTHIESKNYGKFPFSEYLLPES